MAAVFKASLFLGSQSLRHTNLIKRPKSLLQIGSRILLFILNPARRHSTTFFVMATEEAGYSYLTVVTIHCRIMLVYWGNKSVLSSLVCHMAWMS